MRKYKNKELNAKTVDAYNQALKRLDKWLDGKRVTQKRIEEHFLWLQQNYKASTVTIAKAGLKRALKEKKLSWDKIKARKKVARPSGKSFLSVKDLNKLLKHMNEKQKLLTRFIYLSGMRISEALNCKKSDMYERKNYYFFSITGKNGKERESAPIPASLIKSISRAYGKEHDFLFAKDDGSPYTRAWAHLFMKNASEKAGIKLHPHALRHSIASALVDSGENIFSVSTFLGHSSVITTALYYHNRIKPGKIASIGSRIG